MKLMARYLTREIAGGIMAVLLGFLGLFAFFDLINELDDIGQGGYRLPQAVLYVLLGLPSHIYELMPVAALIGCIYALAQFAQNSEFTAMRAAGMSRQLALRGVLVLGVLLAVLSFFMLSRSGRREGIDFKHNRWIGAIVLAAVLGAVSGIYDKYLMASPANGGVGLDRMAVQSWYNLYQMGMMLVMMAVLWWPTHKHTTPFHWDWTIIGISVFLSAADFVYFYSLSLDGAMISIVSMIRRGSVIVSFLFGAAVFHERNLKSKAVDLALVLLGIVFLYIGSRG